MNISREVRRFRRQFKIMGTPGIAKIKQIICQMGYTLLPYAETAEKRGEHPAPAYTLDNGKYKIVYYNDLLNENDLLIVLIHEAAHIYLGHLHRHTGVYDTSVQKDFEAHQFTARLLKSPVPFKGMAAAALLTANLIAFTVPTGFREETQNPANTIPAANPEVQSVPVSDGNVLITSSGDKYHLPNCGYVRNKTNVIRLTKQEAIDAGKIPCLMCIGEE